METCEECLHQGVCDESSRMIWNTIMKEFECSDFKDKTKYVEQKHGQWEQCFEDWRKQIEGDKCSACGFEHYGCSINHFHYCPNCGAKMDGEQ